MMSAGDAHVDLRIEGERLAELRELAYLISLQRASRGGVLHDQAVDLEHAVTIAVAHELSFRRATLGA